MYQSNYNEDEDTGLLKKIFKLFMFIGSALTFIRNFIGNLIMLFIFLVIFSAIQLGQSLKDSKPENQSYAVNNVTPLVSFNLSGYISEKPLAFSEFEHIQKMLIQGDDIKFHELYKIKKAFDLIKKDDYITTVALYLDDMQALPLHVAESIAKSIYELRKANKNVIAYSSTYSQSQYLIASAANQVYMDPFGEIDFKGLALNSLYFKSFLDKLFIDPKIFRAGEYKSATEPLTQDYMSPHVKLENINIANHIYSTYKLKLKEYREAFRQNDIPTSSYMLNKHLESTNGDMALYQLNMGYVDELISSFDFEAKLIKEFGSLYDDTYKANAKSYEDYLLEHTSPLLKNKQIAVVYGIGNIVDKASSPDDFAPENIVPQLLKIRDNDNIKALVFYINSGGGSVTASEQIRRALLMVKEKKPVVISMNGVTASGGYWISTASNKIIATDATITGSIGVFGITFKANRLLNELGIYKDGVITSDLANDDIVTPYTENLENVMQKGVDNIYHKFINLVASSRNLNADNYKEFAEGKVFVAPIAKNLKLIDKLGDLDTAISEACILAKTNRNSVDIIHSKVDIPPIINNLEKIFFKGVSAYIPNPILVEILDIKNNINLFKTDKNKVTLLISNIEDPKL